MPKIIFHIGMPKTGTTAIQKKVSANRELLQKQGILVPITGRFGNANAHHALFYAVTPNKQAVRTPRRADQCKTYDSYIEELNEEIEASKPTFVFLSSEMLWNPVVFDNQALLKLKELFSNHDVCILASLRSIDKHVGSGFAQRVTGPQKFTGTIYDHISELNKEKLWDYKDRLDQFAKVFGRQSVFAYWYDDVKEDALIPFLSLTNASLPAEKNIHRVNVRQSWFFISVVRIVNKFRISEPSLSKKGYILASILEGYVGRIFPEKMVDKVFYPLTNKDVKKLQEKSFLEKYRVDKAYDLFWWKG